jgi:hypothetical protein
MREESRWLERNMMDLWFLRREKARRRSWKLMGRKRRLDYLLHANIDEAIRYRELTAPMPNTPSHPASSDCKISGSLILVSQKLNPLVILTLIPRSLYSSLPDISSSSTLTTACIPRFCFSMSRSSNSWAAGALDFAVVDCVVFYRS